MLITLVPTPDGSLFVIFNVLVIDLFPTHEVVPIPNGSLLVIIKSSTSSGIDDSPGANGISAASKLLGNLALEGKSRSFVR